MEQGRFFVVSRRMKRRKNKFEKDGRLSLGAVYGLEKGLALQLYWMATN